MGISRVALGEVEHAGVAALRKCSSLFGEEETLLSVLKGTDHPTVCIETGLTLTQFAPEHTQVVISRTLELLEYYEDHTFSYHDYLIRSLQRYAEKAAQAVPKLEKYIDDPNCGETARKTLELINQSVVSQ